MKLPLSWLKEQIPLTQSPAEIARLLTFAGLEVDGLEPLALPFEGVVVARVDAVERHPNADKLVVAQVFDGVGTRQVVCGAPNCRPGLFVALAQPGAKLGETVIKPAKLRGVESFGMLCAADELGLSSEGDGILELPTHLKPGSDLSQILGDSILEIGLTPNLGHCASVLGVARELAAITGTPYTKPKAVYHEETGGPISQAIAVDIQDPERCPRYSCRVVKGVKIGPSPHWLRQRLELAGLRSVNNVVDATNYVLLELGHPLHAFDYAKIAGKKVVVRPAAAGEMLVTLDGKQRTLTPDMLMICDSEKPLAVAGVMGGLESEVSDTTTDILLESAYFKPSAVRRTSKALGLASEGSRRFERGADPHNTVAALDRVAFLIQELAGGSVCEGAIDIKADSFDPRQVTLRVSRVQKILGPRLAVGEVENVLKRLDFPYSWDRKDTFLVSVPMYRHDIQGEIDLIEEVARIYGYDNISKQQGRYQASRMPHAPIFLFEQEVRSRLVASGLQEFLTCDLIGPTLLRMVYGHDDLDEGAVSVKNPTSIEQSILRQTLLPGLLQSAKFNIDRKNGDIQAFEIGRVHFKQGEFFKEELAAGILLTGKTRHVHWDRKAADVDFFDLKGILEDVLHELGFTQFSFEMSALPVLHPGRQAMLSVQGVKVGVLGEVHPDVCRRLGVVQRLYYGEVNLHELYRLRKPHPRMEELVAYPGSERDWTVSVPLTLPFSAVLGPIREAASPLLENVELIDLYRGDRAEAGMQNLTLRFSYRDRQKTLQQEAVDREHVRLVQKALASLGGVAKSLGDIQIKVKS